MLWMFNGFGSNLIVRWVCFWTLLFKDLSGRTIPAVDGTAASGELSGELCRVVSCKARFPLPELTARVNGPY